MTITFRTETGSLYELDSVTMVWVRLEQTVKSGTIRTQTDKLTAWPQVVVGQRCALLSPPFVEGAAGRLILTSVVTAIEEVLYLDRESSQVFADALLNPPEPNDALKSAVKESNREN